MAVNVAMELMQALLAQLDPQVKIDSCQVTGLRRRSSRAGAVASYRVHVTGAEPQGVESAATPTPWARTLLFKCQTSPSEVTPEALRWLRNETLVYTRALPALFSFQACCDVATPFTGAASCVAARAGRFLALEDAEARGFRSATAQSAGAALESAATRGLDVATPGMDAEHCDAALRELARLHALSLAMRRRRIVTLPGFGSLPVRGRLFQRSYKLGRREWDSIHGHVCVPAAFKAAVQDCVKEVVFLPEHTQSYLAHCHAITEDAYSMVDSALPPSEDGRWRYLEHFRRFVGDPHEFFDGMVKLAGPCEPLAVLCHGACVADNILFKYDCGRVQEVCFVELATARFASLALDVVTLVFSCASHELRMQRLPRMLAEYHGTMVAQLSDLLRGAGEADLEGDPLEPHTLWTSLQAEFHRCSPFGLGVALDSLASETSRSARFLSVATPDRSCPGDDNAARQDYERRRGKLAELVQELTDNGDL